MLRIVILGVSGAGKTTMAQQLSRRRSLPHIELDALHWEPNWTAAAPEVFRSRVATAIAGERWVLDGNYHVVHDLVWPAADTFVWLDFSMTVVFTRVLARTMRRCWTGQELWNGNRERLWAQLFDRESILLWVITTWRKRRRDYPHLLREQRRMGKRVIRLRTPLEADRWLEATTPQAPVGRVAVGLV